MYVLYSAMHTIYYPLDYANTPQDTNNPHNRATKTTIIMHFTSFLSVTNSWKLVHILFFFALDAMHSYGIFNIFSS